MTIRKNIFVYIKNQYGANPEYLWAKYPNCAVFRHSDNRKWFALITDVPKTKLDSDATDNQKIDIINLKCDSLMIGSLRLERGFFPAYHMNKENWISIALDGSVNEETIFFLLDLSHKLTTKKKK